MSVPTKSGKVYYFDTIFIFSNKQQNRPLLFPEVDSFQYQCIKRIFKMNTPTSFSILEKRNTEKTTKPSMVRQKNNKGPSYTLKNDQI